MNFAFRRHLVLGTMMLAAAALCVRVVELQLWRKDFLQEHGSARHMRVVEQPAHRGLITDRHGQPLAVSSPVNSIWATPRTLMQSPARLPLLAAALDSDASGLKELMRTRMSREFVYLRRQVSPDVAGKVMNLEIPGVYLQQEYKRFYPGSEVFGHVVGFTDLDDNGQEGLELGFDDWLAGEPGAKRVIKDRLGRIVQNVESIKSPATGKELVLSIDKRLQYLTYRELKTAVVAHGARAGSAVLLDARTGELLALANQPSFNPNRRSQLEPELYRNRAVTDVFEPGSTLKPLTIAAALESGLYQPDTLVDTSPGSFAVGHHMVRDLHNYGVIDVATVIRKSSNVGASKIALSLEPQHLASILMGAGLGRPTGAGFPGEASGRMSGPEAWRDIEQATIAFGYGLSVTALQLAQAYQMLANDGVLVPLSVLRLDEPRLGERVISAATAGHVRAMLEAVVREGTGRLARTPGYRVAGKTGTVHKSVAGTYAADRYLSLFAGFAPASQPRLVAVIVVDEPEGEYFGGRVAAPVFAEIMRGALRILDVAPDDPELFRQRLAGTGNPG